MKIEMSKNSTQQRGLRLTKTHAEELVALYGAHAKLESFRADDLLMINYSHVIMLNEQNIITRVEANRILSSIKKLEMAGVDNTIHLDPRVGDLSTHVEAYIINETGADIGGKIHTGRSRNDLYVTLTKMIIRRSILDVYETLLTLGELLLSLTLQHKETILPAYTHYSQHAQPITLGYFFLGNFDVFSRDLQRIEDFWPRLNRSPMGAAALATTGFPINRDRMAALLGFNGVHEHAYDAVSARDFVLEYTFILATIASDLGRIAENILHWNSFELGMVVLADEYTSFSSIMPQKKNPVSLETLRALNSIISSKLYNAFGILKGETWSNGRETIILDDDSVDTGRQVRDMILLLTGILKTMEVQKERMYELARLGFSTATELADTIVRECNFPFRTAHEIVGLVVKKAVDSGLDSTQITVEMVEMGIKEYLEKKVNINPESVRRALDPKENVQIRNLPGGPAFEEVTRMTKNRVGSLIEKKDFLSRCRSQIDDARQDLHQKINEIIGRKTS